MELPNFIPLPPIRLILGYGKQRIDAVDGAMCYEIDSAALTLTWYRRKAYESLILCTSCAVKALNEIEAIEREFKSMGYYITNPQVVHQL